METTRKYIRVVYWGYIGITKIKMGTYYIVFWGYMGRSMA